MAEKENCHGIADYVQNMGAFIENKNQYSNSGNREVDSILNYMLNRAQKTLERVEYKINIPKEIHIQTFDLNIILGNLLENAISAAGSSKDKWLSVFIRYEKGMLFINIRNSYEGSIRKQGIVQ